MDNNFEKYQRPAVAVDVVLFRIADKQLQVALIKRDSSSVEPNKWSVPGGFIDINETIEETIYGKIAEKIGCKNFIVQPLTIKDNPQRDERWRVISCVYLGILIPPFDNEYTCEWFTINDNLLEGCITINIDDLAFDHASMVKEGIQTMRDNLYETDTVFQMVGETFTMSDLQSAFEIVSGKDINNFARRIKPLVEPTGEKVEGKAYRPAAKFRYCPKPKPNT